MLCIHDLSAAEALADFACKDFSFHGVGSAVFQKPESLLCSKPCLGEAAVGRQVRRKLLILNGDLSAAKRDIYEGIVQMVVIQVDMPEGDRIAVFSHPVDIC